MFRRFLREYYLFSPGERRALFVISLALMFSLVIRLILPLLPQREPPGMELFREEVLHMRSEIAALDSLESYATMTAESLNRTPGRTIPRPYKSYSSLPPCDLNRADSASLLPLPGIGPVFAGRIIKYRELLGGYYHPDQLLEVYGMDSSRYLPIKDMLTADSTLLRKIQVNTASFSTLLRHPYLEYEEVVSLVQFRDQMGKIQSMEDLCQNGILMDSSGNSVHHYLNFMENRD